MVYANDLITVSELFVNVEIFILSLVELHSLIIYDKVESCG